jgi:hypothetical protein
MLLIRRDYSRSSLSKNHSHDTVRHKYKGVFMPNEFEKRGIRDLTGQRFGKLQALEQLANELNHRICWLCLCDCGRKKVIASNHLTSGKIISCGCIQKRVHWKHGRHKEPEYRSWVAAKARCFNPKNQAYADYGGRGIKVCEEWRNNFIAFYREMGPCPEGMSLDRIDNNRGYEPGNCRWASKFYQVRNTRSTKMLTFNSKTQVVSDWSRELNIPVTTILGRLKRGLPIEHVLKPRLIPLGQRKMRLLTYDGKTQTLYQWSRELGKPWSTIWSRIFEHGWSIAEAFTAPRHDKDRYLAQLHTRWHINRNTKNPNCILCNQ